MSDLSWLKELVGKLEHAHGWKEIQSFFNWFGPAVRRNPTLPHVGRGFLKASLLYLLPVLVLRRRLNASNIRSAFALGVFVSGVRTVDHLLNRLKPDAVSPSRARRQVSDDPNTAVVEPKQGEDNSPLEEFVLKYSLAIAASVSAMVALLIDGELMNSVPFTIWAMIRAARCIIPSIPFGDVIVMCLSAGQILSTWLVQPNDLSKTYLKFLDNHGDKSPEQMMMLRELPAYPLCNIAHPGIGCVEHVPWFFMFGMLKAARVYLPVYAVSFIFSKQRKVSAAIKNTLISCAFLSAYCTIAWISMCSAQWIYAGKRANHARLFSHTWAAGLALFLERQSRRPELAAYCLTYALESIFKSWERRGYASVHPNLNVFILAIASGIILHNYEQQPVVLIRWLLKLDPSGIHGVFLKK